MNRDTYFIADTHIGFGSRRVVSIRGFGYNWERHEEAVIQGINRVITSKKTLYILGDVGSSNDYDHLKKFLAQLNTRKIILLIGNHDNVKFFKRLKDEHVIVDFNKFYELKYNKTHITLSHYPLFEWPHFFDNGIHLYGHTHATLEVGWRSLDVGIDSIGYTPVSLTELLTRMNSVNNVDKYRNKVFLDKRY